MQEAGTVAWLFQFELEQKTWESFSLIICHKKHHSFNALYT